jgi:endo-1,4-beta-xylanase
MKLALVVLSWLAASRVLAAQDDLIANSRWSYSRALETIPAEGSPGGFTTALRASTPSATPATPWSSQLSVTVPAAIGSGRFLRFRLWARSSTGSRIELVHELNRDPYSKSCSYLFRLDGEWKEVAIPYPSSAYAASDSALRIRTGYDEGTVELAGIRLEDWGSASEPPPAINFDAFGGQARDDSWREAAAERIRRLRMGPLVVRVVDSAGNPVPGAKVKIEQRKSAFLFGTAIANGPLFANTKDGEEYRAHFEKLFNYAVLENQLKWDWSNGNDFATADRMLTWCAERGIPVRGHNLFWPSYRYLPNSVRNLRGQPMRDAIEAHVRDYVTRTRGRVPVWDVVNEVYTNSEVLRDNGRDLFWRAFEWARQTDPDVGLAYNDYNISNNRDGANNAHKAGAMAAVRELLDRGAPVTVVGDQGHMSTPLTPMAKVLETWDEYAQFGLPIEITEFDVVFGGPRDEAQQAAYLADYLTAAFSHPSVKSFLLWGFWDGAHWLGEQGAGLFRRDWSRRPQVEAWERLVLNEWRTKAEGETGEDGGFALRAFLGEYAITAAAGGNSASTVFNVTRNLDEPNEVVVRLP